MDRLSTTNLKKAYSKLKKGKLNTGLDRMNRANFETYHEREIEIIRRKAKNGSYKFTPYKEILISKGKNKYPRSISIPTIRDKIVISTISYALKEKKSTNYKLHESIEKIAKTISSEGYKYYLKLDIQSYYSSIPHCKLFPILENLIDDPAIMNLTKLAIENPSYELNSNVINRIQKKSDIGVPQGISISNLIGYIYLEEYDKQHKYKRKYMYLRYVDDILVLCKNRKDQVNLCKKITEDLHHQYSLTVSTQKRCCGKLSDGLSFLGFEFNDLGSISITHSNIMRIEKNIETLFYDYKNSKERHIKNNIDVLIWKLNLKISGLISNKKVFGWIYYYRLNDNVALMHRLDDYLVKLIYRFGLEVELINSNGNFKGNRFVRTFYEIKANGRTSACIDNIDKYSIEDKKSTLSSVFHRNTTQMNDFVINREFNRVLFKSIKEIEYDLHQIYMA